MGLFLSTERQICKFFTLSVYSTHSLTILQVLNLLVVCSAFILTNMFLNGHFWLFGLNWASSMIKDIDMPENIFPRKAGCPFGFGGGGGFVDNKHNLCILAPNALSEKIFAFLWFWMIFLAGLHIFHIFIN